MGEPDERAIARLRHTASALGLAWPQTLALTQYERMLDAKDPRQVAFMMAIRRAGKGASYTPYREGVVPWHSAMGATYAHGTAPLRRLADRYVVRATLAIANGEPVPDVVSEAFARLPQVMARAEARDGQVERAAIDLAEAVTLFGREGEDFQAVVTDVDDRGARMQLCELPVVARIGANDLQPGERLRVRLMTADPDQRKIIFQPS